MTNLLRRAPVTYSDPVTGTKLETAAGIKRGALVILVGPDGVGKTTIARALGAAYGGPSGYFHFVPSIVAPLSAEPPVNAAPHAGKGRPGGSRLLGCLRLVRNVARFWLAYVIRVRPAMAKGMLVIGDRGMFGYLVQPHALKFHGPASFARQMLRLLPPPALVVNLAAPPHIVRARKQELTLEQIARELRDWRELPATRLVTFDATATPAEIARRVMLEL
jgi:energy-coupling factor transporter ATP-binding protein EcfA2